MPKFIVDLNLDGYNSEPEMDLACEEFIKETLDITTSSVKVKKINLDKEDFVFLCRKCGHELYIEKEKLLIESDLCDCPECGEEGYGNWIFDGEGSYEKFKNKNFKT